MAVTIGWARYGVDGPREIDLEASVARLRKLVEQALGHSSAEVILLLEPALIATKTTAAHPAPPAGIQGQIDRIWQSGTWIVPAATLSPAQPVGARE